MVDYNALNEQQRAAVFQTEGPVLVLAGAGSGKTRVLTYRAAFLIEERHIDPWHILAVTFTNKAAGEMRERIDGLVGIRSGSVWVSTFHSTCVRILRRHIDRLGYENNFTIYDADDQKAVMKNICKRLRIDTKLYKERMFLGIISSAKDELISAEEFTLQAGKDSGRRRQAQVYREYQQELKRNNALDFDDLIVKCVELLKNDEQVLESWQERFRYIMVDEYQDTNTAQFHLVRLLAGKHKNLCVVGDDDQSIYKFRGANIKNILHFEEHFPEAFVARLEENYRSTQNILDAANAVIKNNIGRRSKSLWTKKGAGERIAFWQLENAYEEAEAIADGIQSFVNGGTHPYGDCAVLYRTNAQSRILEEQFIRENIPYRIFGGVNFYARREIRDMLAYLKAIDNANDDLAVRRIINVPKRGIGATTVGRIQEYADANGISFYGASKRVDDIPAVKRGAATKVKSFVALIQSMKRKVPHISIQDLMEEIKEATGYVAELEEEGTEEANGRIENIEELTGKIVSYQEETEEPALGGFLGEVALVADIDSLEEGGDYAALMTLHSAKGLEFQNVYLSGMEEGLFPSEITVESDDLEEMEEERRLCYVGITRAQERLTLTGAKNRMVRGEVRTREISRFVKEIPSELFEDSAPDRESGQWPVGSGQRGDQWGVESGQRGINSGRNARSRGVRRGSQGGFPAYGGEKPYQAASSRDFGTPGKLPPPDYGEGDRVRHSKFGDGTVIKIVSGGRDFEVSVDFDKCGSKKMFASFAKLSRLC